MSTPETPRAPLRLRWVVPVLGIAQIISWGSLFYPIAVLAADIRRDLHISEIAVFGSFTIHVAGGLRSPAVPRLAPPRWPYSRSRRAPRR